MKRLFLKVIALCAMAGFLGSPAYAEGEDVLPDQMESAESSGSEDLYEDLSEMRDVKAPDGSEDYEEIHQLRVLERVFLPGETGNINSGDGLFSAENPLDLSGKSAIRVLGGDTGSPEISRGLQRQSTRILQEAVADVRRQLETSGKLTLPFGLDCASQPAVQNHIAMFTTTSTGTMKTWLKRLERWRPVLEKALLEEDVPTDLIYLAMIESGFKTRVKSPASAAGMWQFMAGTGVEMGLKIDEWVDERFDPIKAAHAAAKYLKKQYSRYHSWPLAMAAYNGGPGTVNVAIDRYNTNDYFKLVQYGAMYDETRRYVPRIMAAAIIGHNPEAFGFGGLKPEPPFIFDLVDVPGGTRLTVLAQAAGCSEDELKELNPELLKDSVPPGSSYQLRIPHKKHRAFVEKFDQLEKKYAQLDSMTLRFGETLDSLGDEIGVAPRVLRSLNGLGAKEQAAYGSSVYVPDGARRKGFSGEPPIALVTPETFDAGNRKRVFYQTQSGDTLREVAAAFGVLPTQLAIWNELDILAKLRSNMFLQIFVSEDLSDKAIRFYSESDVRVIVRGSAEHQALIEARKNAGKKASKTAASSSKKDEYVTYVVAKGDSLAKIAKKFGVTVESIQKLNGLKAKSSIHKGQTLKIKKK